MSNRIRSNYDSQNCRARAIVGTFLPIALALCSIVFSVSLPEIFSETAQARSHKASHKSSNKSRTTGSKKSSSKSGRSKKTHLSVSSSRGGHFLRSGHSTRAGRSTKSASHSGRSGRTHVASHTVTRTRRIVTRRHGRRVVTYVREHVVVSGSRPVSHRAPATVHSAIVSHADLGPPEIGIGPRVRNYSLLARSYSLYDQGVNERLRGNYGSATDKLADSVNLLDQARSNQRDGGASTLEAMVFFELGQAAEADGDLILARDSYAHCLRAKPHYVEAYLRIVNLLATQGQLPLAMNWLKEGLRECPHDDRLNDLSTLLSTYIGSFKPALERDPEQSPSSSRSTAGSSPASVDENAAVPGIPVAVPQSQNEINQTIDDLTK